MTLEEAIEKAAGELPEGAEISVSVERYAGDVRAWDWDGEPWDEDTADMSLADQEV
jgi:hypothetical protein